MVTDTFSKYACNEPLKKKENGSIAANAFRKIKMAIICNGHFAHCYKTEFEIVLNWISNNIIWRTVKSQ